MYRSVLWMTSKGECMDSTGTPMSSTGMPRLATYLAMVPPPPRSRRPSSPICHATPLASSRRVMSPTSSAEASLAELLPRLPVYLKKATPRPA